ncbi:MAG: hypothetical protein Q8922_15505 [Bacteroidota bacterium]|nr:hypothetical protein [Bacteroidota bacterium]MDP4234767.1 hypothetical protein [Bacteroidota bacterium]MDP4244158.1 hypothetical protein [Bacteroidota bacterium]MDP4289320.1 hypothetical protein [Bacteroidota bacterium]
MFSHGWSEEQVLRNYVHLTPKLCQCVFSDAAKGLVPENFLPLALM